jgi:SAM-dependent methyltransferase
MYEKLAAINQRPAPFEFYTAKTLWTEAHLSRQMLKFHLDDSNDLASRRPSFMDSSVAWIQRRFQISEGTRIGDFGCGPGLYATRLAALGAQVTGIDFSERSLQYARESAAAQGLSINFVHGNYLDFDSDERFDLILLISCDYCALSPEQRGQLLRIFSQQLAQDGAILLDVNTLVAFEQRRETAEYAYKLQGGFWSDEDYYGFRNTFKYEAERLILDKFTIITKSRAFEIYNWQQCFDRAALEREFAAADLAIEAWYGNVAGGEYDQDLPVMALVARNRASSIISA